MPLLNSFDGVVKAKVRLSGLRLKGKRGISEYRQRFGVFMQNDAKK